LVYVIHTGKQPLEYHHWQLPGHSLATKHSTLATVFQDLYLCIRTSYRHGGWFTLASSLWRIITGSCQATP